MLVSDQDVIEARVPIIRDRAAARRAAAAARPAAAPYAPYAPAQYSEDDVNDIGSDAAVSSSDDEPVRHQAPSSRGSSPVRASTRGGAIRGDSNDAPPRRRAAASRSPERKH